jgi:creatinine amidohydrolase
VDPRYAGDTLCYVPSSPAEMQRLAQKSGGTSGASTKASRKLGEQYHAHLVDRMLEAIAFLQKQS